MLHPYIPIQSGSRLLFDGRSHDLLLVINQEHCDWPMEGNRLPVGGTLKTTEEFAQFCGILARMHGLEVRAIANTDPLYAFVICEFFQHT